MAKIQEGMIRQHQFEKVEVVKLVHPSESENALDEIVHHATSILDNSNYPTEQLFYVLET